jgi:hypothetical protein
MLSEPFDLLTKFSEDRSRLNTILLESHASSSDSVPADLMRAAADIQSTWSALLDEEEKGISSVSASRFIAGLLSLRNSFTTAYNTYVQPLVRGACVVNYTPGLSFISLLTTAAASANVNVRGAATPAVEAYKTLIAKFKKMADTSAKRDSVDAGYVNIKKTLGIAQLDLFNPASKLIVQDFAGAQIVDYRRFVPLAGNVTSGIGPVFQAYGEEGQEILNGGLVAADFCIAPSTTRNHVVVAKTAIAPAVPVFVNNSPDIVNVTFSVTTTSFFDTVAGVFVPTWVALQTVVPVVQSVDGAGVATAVPLASLDRNVIGSDAAPFRKSAREYKPQTVTLPPNYSITLNTNLDGILYFDVHSVTINRLGNMPQTVSDLINTDNTYVGRTSFMNKAHQVFGAVSAYESYLSIVHGNGTALTQFAAALGVEVVDILNPDNWFAGQPSAAYTQNNYSTLYIILTAMYRLALSDISYQSSVARAFYHGVV